MSFKKCQMCGFMFSRRSCFSMQIRGQRKLRIPILHCSLDWIRKTDVQIYFNIANPDPRAIIMSSPKLWAKSRLGTGGKPSTWLPPGRLVELTKTVTNGYSEISEISFFQKTSKKNRSAKKKYLRTEKCYFLAIDENSLPIIHILVDLDDLGPSNNVFFEHSENDFF